MQPDSTRKPPSIDGAHLAQPKSNTKQEILNFNTLQWPLDNDESLDEQLHRLSDKLLRTSHADATKSPRVLLLYDDERVRDRFCSNARRLLNAALEDPRATSTSALIAHKILRYRKITHRLEEVDPRDPAFDVSAFFGVEWRRKDVQVRAG
ncbi:hypothetical protein ON010_g17512 [Phytophthora cinnamomi]|nr:hypothetical protein ON010_g17512 [Phytophthora cinnamomi]